MVQRRVLTYPGRCGEANSQWLMSINLSKAVVSACDPTRSVIKACPRLCRAFVGSQDEGAARVGCSGCGRSQQEDVRGVSGSVKASERAFIDFVLQTGETFDFSLGEKVR